jgi:hypothetical protein
MRLQGRDILCIAFSPTNSQDLDANQNAKTGEGSDERYVEFDVNKASLINIKLMLESSIALDYGPLYVITAPTQMVIGEEYAVRFTWPRPPGTAPSSRSSDEKHPPASAPLWLGATSDYDPDGAELKSVRDCFGRTLLLNGLICIDRLPMGPGFSSHVAADTEERHETYLVLWGLRRRPPPSTHQDRVSHGELYSESVWCYVVAWDDILDPSLAPLANDLLQLDLGSILTMIQGTLLPWRNDLKETCSVTWSRGGSPSGITAKVWCFDFFGQETLRLNVGSSQCN